MRLFRKSIERQDAAEQRFQAIIDLIKDLPKSDYKRLVDAMNLAYSAYQTVRNVKTVDEREVEDIEKLDKSLEKEENGK